jgi:hypothetical protein
MASTQRKQSSSGLTIMFSKLVTMTVNPGSLLKMIFDNCNPLILPCNNHRHLKTLENGRFWSLETATFDSHKYGNIMIICINIFFSETDLACFYPNSETINSTAASKVFSGIKNDVAKNPTQSTLKYHCHGQALSVTVNAVNWCKFRPAHQYCACNDMFIVKAKRFLYFITC